MFSVIFEILPRDNNPTDYLKEVADSRKDLCQIAGFVDSAVYRSLTRDGWFLSLSSWADEKALVRWRTHAHHYQRQHDSRAHIMSDYHMRVGQVTADNQLPAGLSINDQRFDETEVGEGTTVTLINAARPSEWKETTNPYDCAEWLGLNPWAADSVSWDIFDAMENPGDLTLIISWKTAAGARAFDDTLPPSVSKRIRTVRIVRDYGMVDRREAPQFFPAVSATGSAS